MIRNKALPIVLAAALCAEAYAQSHISTQAHQDFVTAIVPAARESDFEKSYFSAGSDGFLVKWTEDNQGEHYQVTELNIKLAAVSPDKNEVAIYETDGGATNLLSVWNWNTLSRKYAKKFADSITSLAYSENGTYLIAGTATVDGAVFMRASSGTIVPNRILDPTGIVTYIGTTATEKTAVMYSPSGNLSYYNLTNGRLKRRFSVVQGLEQPVMFNNSVFFAGVQGDTIYVIHAATGQTISTVKSERPILLVSKSDEGLHYLENDGKGKYTLKRLDNNKDGTVSAPRIVKTYRGPRGGISCGAKLGGEILLGTAAGAVYRTTADEADEPQPLAAITENTYDKIFDMAPIGEDFYFLTRDALYKSSYDSGIVSRLGENPGYTQLITYGDKVILWSKGERRAVQLFDYNKPELTALFTPKSSVQSVRLFNNSLVELESSTAVNIYDMDGRTLREVYVGAGLQDAVVAEDGKLYVAKSFSTNPQTVLLCIDIDTKETVPMPMNGNVAFALNASGSTIYGICVQSNEPAKKTVVFSFNTLAKRMAAVQQFSDEDSDAFAYLYYPVLYTNVGKNQVSSINLATKKSFSFRRSASMPSKVAQNAAQVVVLNRDGSISWYNNSLSQVLADWYLTRDGQWFEF